MAYDVVILSDNSGLLSRLAQFVLYLPRFRAFFVCFFHAPLCRAARFARFFRLAGFFRLFRNSFQFVGGTLTLYGAFKEIDRLQVQFPAARSSRSFGIRRTT